MLNATHQDLLVAKRDGRVVAFDRKFISVAVQKAFCAEYGLDRPDQLEEATLVQIEAIVDQAVAGVTADLEAGCVSVEAIQNEVEKALSKDFFAIAKRYIIYRDEHARKRQLRAIEQMESAEPFPQFMVNRDGRLENLDFSRLRVQLDSACDGLPEVCSAEELMGEVELQFYDKITPSEIAKSMVLAARTRIERDPAYDAVARRLVLKIIYREALGRAAEGEDLDNLYRQRFASFIDEGVESDRLSPELKGFDLERIAEALVPERDSLFPYLGVQTIYDRYLLHIEGRRIEAPQYFWMRVAMGLAISEGKDKTDRAIEFYNVLSTFRFTSATPTLFNSGTCHPQLSSCYLSTVSDDLDHIFKSIADNAKLSKWAGGLGNDWTNVRATNSHIKGTNGQSQGVIPFLKVVSDTAVAVNQGGKRKGAVCSYLETWHLDIEEFLDLRKNTGDDRRRTHDMHTANWIPDLFMKRLIERQNASGRSSVRTKLRIFTIWWVRHSRARYEEYEEKARRTARSSCVERWKPRTCGERCSRGCSKRDIPGLRSRIRPMFVRRRITRAWSTAVTCAPKFCSTRRETKRRFATWVRSTC